MNVKNRIAIVTGSASGIGQAIVKRLAAHGAKTVVVDINQDNADKTAAEIRAEQGHAIAISCNVTNKAEVHLMVEKVLA